YMAKSKKSKSGLSKGVRRFTVFEDRPGSSTSTRVTSHMFSHGALVKEKAAAQHRINLALSGVSDRAAQQIRDLHSQPDTSDNTDHEHAFHGTAMEVDDYEDEEEDVSEDVLHALRDFLGERWQRGKAKGTRTWRQRLERADANWLTILQELTGAYLQWRYASPTTPFAAPPNCPLSARASSGNPPATSPLTPATTTTSSGDPPPTSPPAATTATVNTRNPPATSLEDVRLPPSQPDEIMPGLQSTGTPHRSTDTPPDAVFPPEDIASSPPRSSSSAASAPDGTRDCTYNFDINVVDMYSLVRSAHIQRDTTQTTVIALAEQGYLASTPMSPTLAITFNTLEHFRLLRLRKPSFSLEAFAKVLCDSYALPYRRRYRTALSDCFDIYLAILHVIEEHVKIALKRDSPDWRVQNSCPACCYELEGEEPLRWRRIFCFDGNNSLKRVAKFGDRKVADVREFADSDYYLSNEFVDQFKHEVDNALANGDPPDQSTGSDHEDAAAAVDPADTVDPSVADHCTRNWKAAANDATKTMWAIFHESGVFGSACRHGFILWIADMVRSGELAKYPLSVISKALAVLGPRLLIGYDIGCKFCGTIDRSSLGADFRRLECRCCVDVFHGYSHSHRCQTQHHPSIIEGAGIEDLGTMERIFSASNQLATITRYASQFHRRVIIDMFFKQWDNNKYANLATMLLENYRQALKIIEEDSAAVDNALRELNYTTADLSNWQEEEAAYFMSVGREPPENAAAVEYVLLLHELRTIDAQLSKSMDMFMTSIPQDYSFQSPTASASAAAAAPNGSYSAATSQTRKKETERRHLREKWDHVSCDVIGMELKMGIDPRWTPDAPNYKATLQYIAERNYQVALEKLHGLVVQHLFELHNMNISQTAYKVRTYIAKNLQRRSEAIRTAVREYNTAAQSLNPPRPTLDWTTVTHYGFLDEFELLRDTRNNIRAKPWAQPLAREAMKKFRRVARAREELVRCNVEIRRLHTSILDENTALNCAVRDARSRGDTIAGPLDVFSTHRMRVNARLLVIISQIHALEGFTGDVNPGVRIGSSSGSSATGNDAASTAEQDLAREMAELVLDREDDTPDDTEMADVARVVNFAVNVS
ncbi:hypothetical protein TRAPUB_11681, partial [Trametes pubescens]